MRSGSLPLPCLPWLIHGCVAISAFRDDASAPAPVLNAGGRDESLAGLVILLLLPALATAIHAAHARACESDWCAAVDVSSAMLRQAKQTNTLLGKSVASAVAVHLQQVLCQCSELRKAQCIRTRISGRLAADGSGYGCALG